MFTKEIMKSKVQFKQFHTQQGWTIWSMAFVMAVIFVLAYIGMNLVPMFSANESVRKAMKGSVETKDLRKISRKAVVDDMKRRLYVDNNHELIDYKKQLRVARQKSQFIVEANYEREIPLVANIVLVARFNPKVECDLLGRCDP